MTDVIPGDRVSEQKQQDALNAARDPEHPMTADEAKHKVADEIKAAGGQAFVFDPDASPEEKAKQAKAHVPTNLQGIRKHKVATLATDQDDSTAPAYDLPTPSKAGALPAPTTPTAASATGKQEDEYEKVGWAPRFGNPGDKDVDATLQDHQTFLDGKLDDKFFGDWYHNTGVIIFACISSWVIAVLGGGLGWVMIIMAICGTYYRTSIRRVRRNFRDDVHRELAKTKLETDHESLEWINSFLVKFWPIYAPVLCATIISSVDQVLSTSTPAFLDSMRMKFFTLGTKPPRLEHVKTYPKAEDDIVLMDWKFSFNPNDTADLTARQIKNKINPKIVLEVRVGKAMISKGLDIIVEDMAFSGLMRVKMKLQIPFPHIEKVEICFLERPSIDYVCKPLGGETFGFDINFVPGLESFIMEQIHANLGPMMYAPNVFPIEIAKMLAGNPVDQAVGVLQVTIHGAQGLKNPDKFSGTPDPYATISINGRDVLGKTNTVHENANPRWSETFNVILTSFKDNLTVAVHDYNEFRKDKELGQTSFALDQLEKEPLHENLQLEIVASGRPRGIVQADIRFFPVLEGAKQADGTEGAPPESNVGIAKFTVESAKELDGSKSMIGQLNPYAVLLLNGKEVQVSQKLKRTNNPIWPDATKELLITDRKKAKLGLVIKDEREIGADLIIGTYQIGLTDMLDLMAKGQEWYTLAGVQSGRAKMQLQWKPVALAGASTARDGYVTPIGVMRVHLKSAHELRNLETMGKSDPYVRVLLSGITKGRTVTFKNNLNPDWDEVVYVPVHSSREKLVIEVMDEETLGKDRSLGSIEVPTSDYVHQDPDTGAWLAHDTKQVISAQLSLGPKSHPKGVLIHTISFFPTIPVLDPEDEDNEAPKAAPSLASKPSLESTRAETPLKNGLGRVRTRSDTAGTFSSIKASTSTDGESEMKKRLAEGEKEQSELNGVGGKQAPSKIRLTADDLGKYDVGLLVFKLHDGDMAAPGCHVEIIMDDNLFPAYISAKARSKLFTFNEVGEAMIRELDLSKITLRMVESVDKKGEGDDNHHFKSRLTGDTINVLRNALYTPHQLVLKDRDGRESKITVSLRFIPVDMKLDPSESVNNQGNLRVEVLDAADLPAADRNGFSDPYCKFSLAGKEVFKSKVQKKTLHPAWNEFFEVPIPSRTAGNFQVEVFDWDLGGSHDFLGKAQINLDVLDPFKQQEVKLILDGKSGVIRLSMLFKPDYVTRHRQGSSTFSGTFAVPGKIVGAPVKGVGKGAVLVGGGVARGASFLTGGLLGKKTSHDLRGGVDGEGSDGAAIVHSPTQTSTAVAAGNGTASPEVGTPVAPRTRSVGNDGGAATVSVLSAAGYPAGAKVQVGVWQGGREVLKTRPLKNKVSGGAVSWEEERHVESKRLTNVGGAGLRVTVVDHSTFGSSEELGEAELAVDEGGETTLAVGAGTVVLRIAVEAGPANGNGLGVNTGGGDAASVRSFGGAARDSPSGKSGLRKSLMSRKN